MIDLIFRRRITKEIWYLGGIAFDGEDESFAIDSIQRPARARTFDMTEYELRDLLLQECMKTF